MYSGFTPLVKAHRLAAALGVKELYIKDDSVNHPTFSYKDRVVSVAISKAMEFGFDTVSCASTGNLANSVAAHAAKAGLKCYVFVPDGLDRESLLARLFMGQKPSPSKGTTTTSTGYVARSATSMVGLLAIRQTATTSCTRSKNRAVGARVSRMKR